MKKNIIFYITFLISFVVGIVLLLTRNDIASSLKLLANIVMLVAGVWLLVKGADWFVDSSAAIAKIMKISALIIGLTVVSFGTSAPELAVSTASSVKAHMHNTTADIALGNVVGSNLANILLVLGLSVSITPIMFKRGILRREMPFLIFTQLLLAFFSFDNFLAHGKLTGGVSNVISRGEALTLFLLIIMFIYILVHGVKFPAAEDVEDLEREKAEAEAQMSEEKKPMPLVLLFLVVGLVGIVLGGVLISDSAEFIAVKIATSAGADKSNATVLVGLTVVAVGTSLPELVTSIIAARRGENEIALGNVIGSNIFNTLVILGVAGTVNPLGINKNILIDMLIMIGVTVLLFVFVIFYKDKENKKIGYLRRWQGLVLLCLYVIYITYLVLRTLVL